MSQTSPLRRFIAEESESLLRTLRLYLYRAGLARAETTMDSAANELLNDVVAEALMHENRFRAEGQPRAWLLGIAGNLIRRRQVDHARRLHREPLVRDLYGADGESLSDDDLFDRVAELANAVDDEEPGAEARIREILQPLPPADQEVIWLAIVQGLDGEAVARAIGVKASTARVRLHRALHRLRQHMLQQREAERD
jgi:RNA polymerase sigma-70 factor (ECF subfamily)